MSINERQIYRSSNGDRWSLVRDGESGRVLVRHEPNASSGGRASQIEIGDFLAPGGNGPEHQELLRLIGTLIEERTGASERSSKAGGPDRKHLADSGDYQVDELARRHGISSDQASRLIRQIGPDREKLDEEAAKLAKDSDPASRDA